VLHNLATQEEVEMLMQYGKDKGMSEALITPYGSNQLVPSTTRTNTAAWLDFQQNELVKKIEDKLAEATGTRAVRCSFSFAESCENNKFIHIYMHTYRRTEKTSRSCTTPTVTSISKSTETTLTLKKTPPIILPKVVTAWSRRFCT
jgi:hypothetical protein